MNGGVDDRYNHPGKKYIPVTACFHTDGVLEPLSFDWLNDDESVTTYTIDKVLEAKRMASQKAGGTGIRYTVKVKGRERHIYLESDRWFVETKQKTYGA